MIKRLALILALVLVPVCAAGQIAQQQAPATSQNVGLTHITSRYNYASSVPAGTTLILILGQQNDAVASVSETLGDTVTQQLATTHVGCCAWSYIYTARVTRGGYVGWIVNAPSGSSETATLMAYTGVVAASMVDCTHGGTGTSSPVSTGNCVTAGSADLLLSYGFYDYGIGATWGATAGWSQIVNFNGAVYNQQSVWSQNPVAAGTYANSISISGGTGTFRSLSTGIIALVGATNYTAAGTVSGFGAGTTITVTDGSANVWGKVFTDGSGNYTTPGLPNGTYTLTPACGSFSPSTLTPTISGANSTGNNFTDTSGIACPYVRDAAVINASAAGLGAVSSLTATWGTPTATGDGVVVSASNEGGGSPVISLTTICGQPAHIIDYAPTAKDLTLWYAMDVASGCTSATVASTVASSNFTVAAVDIGALPTNYIIENYNHKFGAGSPTTASVPTLGANDFLLSTTIDTSHLYTFAPSGSFSVLLNQSTTVPIMQVSTTSGGPGTYTNAVTGGSGSTYQTMLAIRSVLPTFGVLQFTDPRSCQGSGVTLTCPLPLPTTTGNAIVIAGIPYGSGDLLAPPTDDQSNTYLITSSVLASINGAGHWYIASNITGSSSYLATLHTLTSGSATTFSGTAMEIVGASTTKPYFGGTQDVKKNYATTTNFPFGPFTFPAGNYLELGTATTGTEVAPYAVTNGIQLGPDSSHLGYSFLDNVFVGGFSTAGSHTMTVTPASGQPYNWASVIVSAAPQTEGRVRQSMFASYGLGGAGLLSIQSVAAGATMFVWGPMAGIQTISSTPPETWIKDCGATTGTNYGLFHATGVTGGDYVLSMPSIGVGDAHFAILNQAGTLDGVTCNQGLVSAQPINSGPVTTTHTDMIFSCGSIYAAFGDESVSQDGTWVQSFTSQFSDYDGGQCSVQYAQPPGTYTSAGYSSSSAAGTSYVGAAVFAFSDTVQPSGNYMPQIVRMNKALHAPDLIAAMKEMGQ